MFLSDVDDQSSGISATSTVTLLPHGLGDTCDRQKIFEKKLFLKERMRETLLKRGAHH